MRNNEYFKLGKFTTLSVNIWQGIMAIGTLQLRHHLTTPIGMGFTIIWIVCTFILFTVKSNTPSECSRYTKLAIAINALVGFGIVVAFSNPFMFLTTLIAQWVTVVLYLDKKVCIPLAVSHVLVLLFFHLSSYFGFYTIPEMIVIISAIIVACWCARSFMHVLIEQYKLNEMQRQSMDDLVVLLDAKYEEAKLSSKAKGNFLANMSHEIRTPINSVLGFNTMILRECNDQKIKDYALNIQGAGRALLNIINDILDFSKIESGRLDIIPVEYDFASMIYDEINMINSRVTEKGLELKIEVDQNIPSWLLGDDVRVRQIVTNLLTNAVKYTSSGSITLRVEYEREENMANLHFSIIDTGNGIKEEDLSKLYETFVRIEEKRNRNIEGTGLGINIVTSLLNAMGSKLEVESVYGEGSNFHFRIQQQIIIEDPIGDVTKKQIIDDYEHEISYTAPNARLLVVDDNPMNLIVFSNLLKPIECHIDEVSSGKECIMLLSQYKYDIIFMDHMMPGWDGIETFHKIQELSPEENLSIGCPVIILTANAISGAKEMYLKEGFNDFVSKPVIPEDLERVVKEYLPQELILEGGAKKNKVSDTKLEEFPKINGVDWNYGYLHLPSSELLTDTVKKFYAMINTEADELEELFKKIDGSKDSFDGFRIKVHAMKSSATLWGALPIAGTAAMLEFAAKDENLSLINDVTPHFIEEWRGYREKLKEFVGDNSLDDKEAYDRNEVCSLLDELVEKISLFEIHAADEALEKIKSFEYPNDIELLLEKITGLSMNLDIEKVAEASAEMKQKL